MIKRTDWKEKIAVVELRIAVEQVSHDDIFLPPSHLSNLKDCWQLGKRALEIGVIMFTHTHIHTHTHTHTHNLTKMRTVSDTSFSIKNLVCVTNGQNR